LETGAPNGGQQYEYLNKVVLFDPPLKYPLDVEYILYFKIDISTPEGKKSEENGVNHFNLECNS